MKTESGHTNLPDREWEKIEDLNAGLTVKWDEPKEEIWGKLVAKLAAPQTEVRVISLSRSVVQWAAAAVILVLLGITGFLRFYTQSYTIPAGEHFLAELPDYSQVQLNAGSSLSYHPYWWSVERKVSFEGEAYFEVRKGSRFQVESGNGLTTVLGTSFNIYARENNYRVTCLTGKVKVSNPAQTDQVILLPNEKAEWVDNAFQKRQVESKQAIAWIKNEFIFTGRPIREVFAEIERQYNIRLLVAEDINFSYSGNFNKEADFHQVLHYVCRPLNLNFIEEKPGMFRIEKSN
ncbi:FecR family protein [Mangrovibacterium lignilyticum]|uniref:FecR family protein n=1 Tax=Mangrovibacterium lignilyticum TaxID=2668052 RepID=UPI0013D8A94F|nr:FecR family protein [Mangrovibacterium lignilyticum]